MSFTESYLGRSWLESTGPNTRELVKCWAQEFKTNMTNQISGHLDENVRISGGPNSSGLKTSTRTGYDQEADPESSRPFSIT